MAITPTPKIWMNGELVAWDEARIHVLTHTLHYGMGVFEGIRAYGTSDGPAVFRLTEHIERLHRSAHMLGMEIPFSVDELITATKAMAVELAPHGVRVNAINPVAGETPLLKSFMGEDTPERRAQFLSTIPIGRFSTPEDMGAAAVFLCSDDASMITGVAMEIDGGRCI